jgi:response regulator RpfG family c-di-GMP phosphodiesterase
MSAVTVLLVDDEPQLLETCKEALDAPDRVVLTAADGLKALNILAGGGVDLVVSDLKMPRLSGMELLRRIGEQKLDADVIVLTGYGTVQNAVECLKLGAADYLLKPFKIADLTCAVDDALRERGLRRQQGKVDQLVTMLDLQSALSGQSDQRAMIKAFLNQVRETFDPDGIALFFSRETLGQRRDIALGPYFRAEPATRGWFAALADRLLRQGRPRLLSAEALSRAMAGVAATPPGSVLGAPVAGGGHSTGAVVVLRTADKPPYGGDDLHLLAIFASHASLCFESQRNCAMLKEINRDILFSLASAVEAKDTYTRGHSERVGAYGVKLGRALSLTTGEIELLRMAGVLHDIGKIGVPDHILNKPAGLSPDETKVMRQHPGVGRTILSKVASLEGILPIVTHHHEHVNGQGYPDGLAGTDIPFLARALSVVDSFEAMTSDRAYHPARNQDQAVRLLADGAGTQWDAEVVAVWLQSLADRPR